MLTERPDYVTRDEWLALQTYLQWDRLRVRLLERWDGRNFDFHATVQREMVAARRRAGMTSGLWRSHYVAAALKIADHVVSLPDDESL